MKFRFEQGIQPTRVTWLSRVAEMILSLSSLKFKLMRTLNSLLVSVFG